MGGTSEIKPTVQAHRPKIYKMTSSLPGASGIAVTKGVIDGSPFEMATINLKYNKILVYVAPKGSKKFVRRNLEFINSKYKDTDIRVHVVVNGTFYNVKGDCQPLGIIICRNGEFTLTPNIVNYKGNPVYLLNRSFFGIKKDGSAVIGRSGGKTAKELRDNKEFVELIGGGGPLIENGKSIVSEKILKSAGISESTHQMNRKRQRTFIAITKSGKILIGTFGRQYGPNRGNRGRFSWGHFSGRFVPVERFKNLILKF